MLTAWLVARDNAEWDRQMDEDSAAGNLDSLFDRANEEAQGSPAARAAGGDK